jgi:hypothetical protein
MEFEKDPNNVVIARAGDNALIYRECNKLTPYIVAYGYNEERGDWCQGSYHDDLGRAYNEFHPEIIEGLTTRWHKDDVFYAACAEVEVDPDTVDDRLRDRMVAEFVNDKAWVKALHDRSIEVMNEMLHYWGLEKHDLIVDVLDEPVTRHQEEEMARAERWLASLKESRENENIRPITR